MASLQHGILIAKIAPFAFNLIGFYFTPVGGETKCLLLDPSIDKSQRLVSLSEILFSGAFSNISYRELINPNDAKRFKLALVNMQSSFDSTSLEIAIRDNIRRTSCTNSPCTDWENYSLAHIDYVSKAVGQNPAERVKQCSGECFVGPVPDIKSYDPFGPPKIYHRNIPIVTSNDKLKLKGWSEFFSISYGDLQDTLPLITLATPSAISPIDTLFQSFLISIIDNGIRAGDVNPIKIPLSFRVPSNYIFTNDPNNEEKILTTWGLNIYDGACWEIALWLLKDSNASLLDDIRLSRKTTQFASIIGNNVNSRKANMYLAPISVGLYTNPTGASDPTIRNIVYPYDPNGLSFRIISNYYNYDPVTILPQQWSSTAKHWNHFNPTLGENAWFYALSPFIRNANITNFKGYSGFNSILFNLMDSNGGFFYSPIKTKDTSWSLSSEYNASMYGALSQMISYLTSNPSINIGISIGQLSSMIMGIGHFFVSMADRENFLFHQRKIWTKESSWQIQSNGIKVNESNNLVTFTVTSNDVTMLQSSNKPYVISVNVQTWIICSLQPKIIDQIFGIHGAALKQWNNLKTSCGRFNQDGELEGFGYTNIKTSFDYGMATVISTECTFSAMMACKILKEYYGEFADTSPYSITSDLAEMESFVYDSNNNLLFVSDNEAYFNSANIRAQTGLGDFINPIPSIAATSWHIFYIKSFNPFVPNGKLLR